MQYSMSDAAFYSDKNGPELGEMRGTHVEYMHHASAPEYIHVRKTLEENFSAKLLCGKKSVLMQ